MKTKEEILMKYYGRTEPLTSTLLKHNQSILDAMEEYANQKANPLNCVVIASEQPKAIQMNDAVAETSNPHWIGDEPAWDINITENITLKDITQKEILLLTRNHINECYKYETVVRRYHIDALQEVKLNVKLIK